MAEKYAEKRYWQTPSARQKRVRILTWVIIAASILGPLSFIFTVTKSDPELPPSYNPPLYAGAATVFLQAWINGEPSPISVNVGIPPTLRQRPSNAEGQTTTKQLPITNVAWTSYTTLPNGESEFPRELHRFLGTMNNQSILIYVTITGTDIGPVLVSDPAIISASFLKGNTNVTFQEGEPLIVEDGLEQQIKLWAEAYGTDNRNTLLRLTGDPNAQIYPGLPGGNYKLVEDPSIIKATVDLTGKTIVSIAVTYIPTQEPPRDPNNPNPTQQPAPIPQEGQEFTLQFDLLIENAEQTFPYVVAWGPIGTGTLLTPYENAVQQAETLPEQQQDPFATTETTTTTTAPQPPATTPEGTTQ